MNELDLPLGSLNLKLVLRERQVEDAGKPYLDWLQCDVSASTPSFSGRFRWLVMPCELLSLADKLAALYDKFPQRGSVTFEPAEPNVVLFFEIGATGSIDGTYSLMDVFVDGDVLHGHFAVEQSGLPKLASDIRDFVRCVAPTA